MEREDDGRELLLLLLLLLMRLNGEGAVDVGDDSDVCDCC